jgi:hypothetical protein
MTARTKTERQKQIPPLRCGMTNKRTGNSKGECGEFFPFDELSGRTTDELRVRMTTVRGDPF